MKNRIYLLNLKSDSSITINLIVALDYINKINNNQQSDKLYGCI